jgi:lipoprotein-anchoring transpeptidase ErfK/SrfK
MPSDPPPRPAPAPPEPPTPQEEAAALPEADSRTLRIDLPAQGFRYFEDGRLVRSGPVSAGSAEHPTPTGEYRVQSKDADKVSHSYTNFFDLPTPMPYSLQFHGPYFIHEGWLPGYPDSHGCVRLHYEDARFLFERMKVGDAVVITGPERQRSPTEPERRTVASGSRRAGVWLSPGDPRLLW